MNISKADWLCLDEAKKNIIRWHQQQAFPEEIKQLRNTYMQKEKQIKKKRGIYNLDPYLDKEGLLRIGGRLKKWNLHFSDVHSLLIGGKSKTTSLIVEWCHQKTAHGGRGLTINEVRSNRFWVVKCNSGYKFGRKVCQMPPAYRKTWRAKDGRLTNWYNSWWTTIYKFRSWHVWSLFDKGRKERAEKIQDTFHLFSKQGSPYWMHL